MVERGKYPPFTLEGRVLAPQEDGDGYLHVALGRGNTTKVHKLVAKVFIPNPDDLPEVDHEDTDKKNCRAGNLRWCTKRQNSAYRHGNSYVTCTQKFDAETRAKIAAAVAAGTPIQHVAKAFGVSRAHARRLGGAPAEKVCGLCASAFTAPAESKRLYCSTYCATRVRFKKPPFLPDLS